MSRFDQFEPINANARVTHEAKPGSQARKPESKASGWSTTAWSPEPIEIVRGHWMYNGLKGQLKFFFFQILSEVIQAAVTDSTHYVL